MGRAESFGRMYYKIGWNNPVVKCHKCNYPTEFFCLNCGLYECYTNCKSNTSHVCPEPEDEFDDDGSEEG